MPLTPVLFRSTVYTTEYYLVLKRNEILTRTTTWMNLENVVLSEVSETQKYKYCVTPFTQGTRSGQIHGKENSGCQGLKGGTDED